MERVFKLFFFQLAHKPENISDIGAAGILYAGLTAWSSIYISGLAGGIQGAKTSKGAISYSQTK